MPLYYYIAWSTHHHYCEHCMHGLGSRKENRLNAQLGVSYLKHCSGTVESVSTGIQSLLLIQFIHCMISRLNSNWGNSCRLLLFLVTFTWLLSDFYHNLVWHSLHKHDCIPIQLNIQFSFIVLSALISLQSNHLKCSLPLHLFSWKPGSPHIETNRSKCGFSIIDNHS